jgi:hypothetical protein
MGRSINALYKYPNCLGDRWILGDYLHAMILKLDDKKSTYLLMIYMYILSMTIENLVQILKYYHNHLGIFYLLIQQFEILDWVLVQFYFNISSGTLLRMATRQVCRPLHTRDWEPVTITLQALSLVEKVEPVQVCFTLCSRDQRCMWMQDGCKAHMDSYMASHASCFMVTWIIFNNHFLEIGLTQNRDTMKFQMLTTVDLLYFIMCEDPHD